MLRVCGGLRALHAFVLAATALMLTPGMPAVEAQQPAAQGNIVNFNIPAQSLTSALTAFARQSGVQLAYPASLTAGKSAPALSGQFTRAAALGRLLGGSGLTYSFTGANAATISDPTAGGNNAAATVEGAIALDTIDVSGGGGSALDKPYQTPGATAYISRGDIEQFPGTSPGDIFKSTAGVLVGEARNSGAIDVNIRGMQGYGRTAVTIDGSQQQSNIDRGYFGDANRTFIDPDLLSGVSITKGPSNDPAAGGAIGGQVAMTTLNADDIIKPGKTWGIRMRGGMNTNSASPPPPGTVGGIEPFEGIHVVESNVPDYPVSLPPPATRATGRPGWFEPTGGNGSVAFAAKQDNFELVAATAYRENGNYYAGTRGKSARQSIYQTLPENYTATQDMINDWNVSHPGHGIKAGDDLRLDQAIYANLGLSDYRAGEEVFNTSLQTWSGLLKAKVKLDEENTLELGYMRNESRFGFLWPSAYKFLQRPEQTPLSEATVDTWTAKYKYDPAGDLVRLSLNAWFTRQQFDETQTYSFNSYTNYVDSDALMGGFDVSNVSEFSGAWGNFALQYGVAYLNENSIMDTNSVWKAAGDYWAWQEGKRRQWDSFTNATWKPTEWLTASVGARYVTVTNSFATSMSYKDGVLSPTSTPPKDRTADGIVPQTSLTIEPLKGLQFYGSYKEGIRVPSFIENRDIGPNSGIADLKPEHAHTYEAGVNVLAGSVLAPGDKLGVKVNYFLNLVDDYIMMEYAYQSFILTTMNYDKARFSGVELSAMYDSGTFFGSASAIVYDHVELCKTATLCYSSRSDEGIPLNDWRNHIPPKISASVTLGVRLLEQKLTLAGRLNYTGERAGMPERYFNSNSPYWLPYTTVDAFASYKFEDDLVVELSGENLFDKYYVDALAVAQQPAPGRTLRLNVTKTF